MFAYLTWSRKGVVAIGAASLGQWTLGAFRVCRTAAKGKVHKAEEKVDAIPSQHTGSLRTVYVRLLVRINKNSLLVDLDQTYGIF